MITDAVLLLLIFGPCAGFFANTFPVTLRAAVIVRRSPVDQGCAAMLDRFSRQDKQSAPML